MSRQERIQGVVEIQIMVSRRSAARGLEVGSIRWNPDPHDESDDEISQRYVLSAETPQGTQSVTFTRDQLEAFPNERVDEVEQRLDEWMRTL